MSDAQDRRVAQRQFEDEIVAELVNLGASKPAVHFVLTVIMGADVSRGMVAQRFRRALEKRGRERRQQSDKPGLKTRCLKAYVATCAYCDRTDTPEADPDGKPWNLDRIVAGRFGGEYEAGNVALACHACNQRKGQNFVAKHLRPPSLLDLEAA